MLGGLQAGDVGLTAESRLRLYSGGVVEDSPDVFRG